MAYLFWMMMMAFATSYAEIVKVNVQWQPETCPLGCVQNLAGQFQKLPGVAQINISQSGGYAELRWKPGVPFLYSQVKGAMQAVGPGIRDIRVKVRGTLKFEQQTVSLVSLGDNTVFYLIGQINAKEGQTAVYYSLESHQLSQDMFARLAEGYQQQRIAVIEGPLFEPWRYPYLWLIVDQLQFVQSENTQAK